MTRISKTGTEPLDEIVLVYSDGTGQAPDPQQPLSDLTEAGPLVDPETEAGLELVGWRFAEGDAFVVVEGGLVANDPGIPVFDLDVLDSDSYPADALVEVMDLYDRVAAHPTASKEWSSILVDAAAIIRGYGAPEDVELIDEKEAARLAQAAPEDAAEG